MMYLGDFKEDDVVSFIWSTNDANGASIARTVAGTIHVYKDVNAGTETQLGITNVATFDGLVGIHSCSIDLNVDAFYAVGSDYAVVLKAATIDTQTVNAVIAHFSIENRYKGEVGADDKFLISSDAQDLSATLDVNTKTITAGIIANAAFNVDVGTTAYATNRIALAGRKVLDEIKLDHLVAVADGDDPVNNSIIAQLAATDGDWSNFAKATDSLKSIRDVAPHGSAMVGTNNAALAATALSTVTWTPAKAAFLDAAISTRSSHTAANVRDAILDDATRFSGADIAAILADTGVIGVAGVGLTNLGGMSAGMRAEVESECNDALVALDLDHLINITAGGANPVIGTYIDLIMNKNAGQTFAQAADSLEAIRDRGDAAWITAAAITEILNIQPLIPISIDLADTVTVRIGLGLTNMLNDLPTTVEITPGTITIDRKECGGASWTTVVNDEACSEAAGLVYYDEIFDSASEYASSDSIRITFKNQKITVGANDYVITDANGWIFHTLIREEIAKAKF